MFNYDKSMMSARQNVLLQNRRRTEDRYVGTIQVRRYDTKSHHNVRIGHRIVPHLYDMMYILTIVASIVIASAATSTGNLNAYRPVLAYVR